MSERQAGEVVQGIARANLLHAGHYRGMTTGIATGLSPRSLHEPQR
jgi:hypothetical protein